MIKDTRGSGICWERLRYLVETVSYTSQREIKKEPLSQKLRVELKERDKGICFVCGAIGEYGCAGPFSSGPGRHNFHHIIPNGKAHPDNLVTLCGHCHTTVHELLFVDGRWRYTRV